MAEKSVTMDVRIRSGKPNYKDFNHIVQGTDVVDCISKAVASFKAKRPTFNIVQVSASPSTTIIIP